MRQTSNTSKNMKIRILSFLMMGSLLVGCQSNKPSLEEELIGAWNQVKCYELKDSTWVEAAGERSSSATICFRADSTILCAMTDLEGQTSLHVADYEIDNRAETFTTCGIVFPITRRDENEFEMAYGGEKAYAESSRLGDEALRFVYRRMDANAPQLLTEKIQGKWKFITTYRKAGEQWEEYPVGLPDEAYNEYREDGTMVVYVRIGEREIQYEMLWSMNNQTGEMRGNRNGRVTTVFHVFTDDNRMEILYSNYTNAFGESSVGEYKDIFERM